MKLCITLLFKGMYTHTFFRGVACNSNLFDATKRHISKKNNKNHLLQQCRNTVLEIEYILEDN